MSWLLMDSGKTVVTRGSEEGVIVLDEAHTDGARITARHSISPPERDRSLGRSAFATPTPLTRLLVTLSSTLSSLTLSRALSAPSARRQKPDDWARLIQPVDNHLAQYHYPFMKSQSRTDHFNHRPSSSGQTYC